MRSYSRSHRESCPDRDIRQPYARHESVSHGGGGDPARVTNVVVGYAQFCTGHPALFLSLLCLNLLP